MNRAELASLLEQYQTAREKLRNAIETIALDATWAGEANHAGMIRMELSQGHLAWAAERALEYLEERERERRPIEILGREF